MSASSVAAIVVFAILAALVVLSVLSPIGSRAAREHAREQSRRLRLEEERLTLVQLLRDLRFDKRTGKLTEEDFQTAYSEAEARVLSIMEQLETRDRWTSESIEEEIARMRRRLEREAPVA